MKTLRYLMFGLGMALAPALAATADTPAVDLAGEWYFEVQSPNGPGWRELLVRQEGSRVIGFINSDSASGRFVGHFDGNKLEFTAVLEFGGQPMAAVYRAKVAGDHMSGSIEYGDYGKATFTGRRGRRPVPAGPSQPIVGSAAAAGIAVAADGDRFGVLQKGMLLPEMLAIPGGRFRMGNNGRACQDFCVRGIS